MVSRRTHTGVLWTTQWSCHFSEGRQTSSSLLLVRFKKRKWKKNSHRPRQRCQLLDSVNGICSSSIGSIDSPLSSSITPSLFHSKLKTFLFCKSFPPQPSFSSSGLTSRMIRRTVYRYLWSYPFRIVEYADVVVNWCYLKTQCWFVQYHIGNESVPIQLAQCRFPGLAISNANMLIHFSNMEAILSNSTWKLSLFEIAKTLIAV